jgi:hypothetical protein
MKARHAKSRRSHPTEVVTDLVHGWKWMAPQVIDATADIEGKGKLKEDSEFKGKACEVGEEHAMPVRWSVDSQYSAVSWISRRASCVSAAQFKMAETTANGVTDGGSGSCLTLTIQLESTNENGSCLGHDSPLSSPWLAADALVDTDSDTDNAVGLSTH